MPKKNIELLLTESVENLGIVGDVVHVRPGYARNFLLPMGLAVAPTDKAKDALAERRKQAQAEFAALQAELRKMVEELEGYELTLERSCNDNGWLYGSVTQHDIAEALHAAGFARVSDRHVRIGVSIKRVDSYEIPIQINADLKTEIKLWVVPDRESSVMTDEYERERERDQTDIAAEGTLEPGDEPMDADQEVLKVSSAAGGEAG